MALVVAMQRLLYHVHPFAGRLEHLHPRSAEQPKNGARHIVMLASILDHPDPLRRVLECEKPVSILRGAPQCADAVETNRKPVTVCHQELLQHREGGSEPLTWCGPLLLSNIPRRDDNGDSSPTR